MLFARKQIFPRDQNRVSPSRTPPLLLFTCALLDAIPVNRYSYCALLTSTPDLTFASLRFCLFEPDLIVALSNTRQHGAAANAVALLDIAHLSVNTTDLMKRVNITAYLEGQLNLSVR